MGGSTPVGQLLTPNPNVFAPVQVGGDTWGANGGDAVAAGGGAVDQTGYVKPIMMTTADGETATNYIPSTVNRSPPVRTVIGQESNAKLSGQTQDTSLASGGSNAG